MPDLKKAWAKFLVHEIELDAKKMVHDSFLGISLTPKTRKMAIRLQTLLVGKDKSYSDLKFIFLVHPIEDLEIEEDTLGKLFGFANIPEARNLFCLLVIAQMKSEAREVGVNLKPLYVHDRETYNTRCFLNDAFNLIPSPAQTSEKTESNVPPVYSISTSVIPLTEVEENLKKFIVEEVSKVKSVEVEEHNKLGVKIEAMDKVVQLMISNIQKELLVMIKEAVSKQISHFVSEQLKTQTDKLLPHQLKALKVAEKTDVENLNFNLANLKSTVEAFLEKLTQITSSSLKKDEEMRNNITSLLQFKEKANNELTLKSHNWRTCIFEHPCSRISEW